MRVFEWLAVILFFVGIFTPGNERKLFIESSIGNLSYNVYNGDYSCYHGLVVTRVDAANLFDSDGDAVTCDGIIYFYKGAKKYIR